jgi:hypothetical protein
MSNPSYTWGIRIKLNTKNGDVETLLDPYYESEEKAQEATQWVSRQANSRNTRSISTPSQKVHFNSEHYRSVEVYKLEELDEIEVSDSKIF